MMSGLNLRQYYDTQIKPLSFEERLYNKIKRMMEKGERHWKIKLFPEQYLSRTDVICSQQMYRVGGNDGGAYIIDPKLIHIIEFITEQGLNCRYERKGRGPYLVIYW